MLGIDYAWQHPDPKSIKDAGYGFACRYVSRDTSKNITLSEALDLAAHGIWTVANWEYGAQDMLRGYNGGVADATLALAQATAAGMPKGRPIYFSADWDVTPSQEAMVTNYLRGAASVLGSAEVGEYAGFYPVKVALDGGTAHWTWQTTAWSGGQWDAREQIRQTGSAYIGGVQVDVNQALVDDFGQWQPGRLPSSAPLAQETDMKWIAPVDAPAGGSSPGIWGYDNGVYFHIGTPAEVGFFETQLGVKQSPQPISQATHQSLLARTGPSSVAINAAQVASAIVPLLPTPPTADEIAADVTAHLGSALSNG